MTLELSARWLFVPQAYCIVSNGAALYFAESHTHVSVDPKRKCTLLFEIIASAHEIFLVVTTWNSTW